jgi:hypothetical protein
MGVKVLTFIDGSAPPADAAYLNSIVSEVNGVITNTGQTPSVGTLTQLETAVSIYAAGGDFYTDSGAADAYVLSVVGSKRAPDAYFVGMTVRFDPGNVNTGASTINVATLGAKNIKLGDGATNPAAGDIPADSEIQLTYDGTNFNITARALPPIVLAGELPVGSIYINKTVATNPGTLLGYGTWTAETDKFFVSRGATYVTTGGAATHSNSLANNGPHTHTVALASTVSGSETTHAEGATAASAYGVMSTSSSGSGTAFSIIPPYQAYYTWLRTV